MSIDLSDNPGNRQSRQSLYEIAEQLGRLVEEKNKAYGSSFEKTQDFLKLVYPNGISVDQYGDALLLVRIFDKQMRIASNKNAFGENPYSDIAGYGICGVYKDQKGFTP